MAKAVARVVDKWKKKKWFQLVASEPFKGFELGESPANAPTELMGRTTKVNLMNLTRNIKDQNVNITFEVNDVKGTTGFSRIKKYELLATQVKRLTRRKRDKLDDSFVVITKDKHKVRIKPMVVMNNTQGAQKRDVRKALVEMIKANSAKISYEVMVMEIINRKFQKGNSSKLHKIFPVRSIEVRRLVLEGIEA